MSSTSKALAAILAAAIVSASVMAEDIFVRGNTIVPIVLEDELSFKESREGDRFNARVDDSRDLPYRSRLEGRIINIEPKRGDRLAYMDVEFDSLLLPDGTRHSVRAVPIALDSKYVNRDRDGRLTGKKGALRKEHYVLGGVIGGALLGSIIGKKAFEGAFVGAIAGIILAETSSKDEQVALKRGTRMGALFEKDVRITFDGQWGSDSERYPRNDRYDPRDDRYSGGADGRDDAYRNERLPEELRIECDERELRFSGTEKPYRMGETIMVPLERTAGQIGLDFETTGSGTIWVESDDAALKLEQDSSDFRLNGKRGKLSRNVVKRNGTIYVPLEALAALKKDSVYVNGNKLKNISY